MLDSVLLVDDGRRSLIPLEVVRRSAAARNQGAPPRNLDVWRIGLETLKVNQPIAAEHFHLSRQDVAEIYDADRKERFYPATGVIRAAPEDE